MSGPQQYPSGGQPGYGQPNPGGQPPYGSSPSQPPNQEWQGNQFASAPPPPAPTYAGGAQPPRPGGQPTGPLGQPRSIGICILLEIVTFGIYGVVWTYKTHKEIHNHSGEGVTGGIGLLIYIFGGGTVFLLPYIIKVMLRSAGRDSRVSPETGFWVLLPFIGALIWFIKVQSQLNDYWDSLGAHR